MKSIYSVIYVFTRKSTWLYGLYFNHDTDSKIKEKVNRMLIQKVPVA